MNEIIASNKKNIIAFVKDKIKIQKNIIVIILLVVLTTISVLNFLGINFFSNDRAEIKLSIASIHNQIGHTDTAIKEIQKIIKANPKYTLAYVVLAEIYADIGDLEGAWQNYMSAAQIEKGAEQYFDVARTSYKLGYIDEAIDYYKKSIEANTSAINAYLALASIYFEDGNFAEGKKYIDEALIIDYNNPDVHNDLGVYYEGIGDVAKAREEYLKALEIDPTNTFANNNLDRIDGVQ